MSDIQTADASTHGAPNGSPSEPTANVPFWRAAPELDVYESASEYLIVVNVPGAAPESVDVQVLGTTLQIRARQASASGARVARIAFERQVELPSEVDASTASAKLRDGVLQINIQKSAAARRVKIPVNTN